MQINSAEHINNIRANTYQEIGNWDYPWSNLIQLSIHRLIFRLLLVRPLLIFKYPCLLSISIFRWMILSRMDITYRYYITKRIQVEHNVARKEVLSVTAIFVESWRYKKQGTPLSTRMLVHVVCVYLNGCFVSCYTLCLRFCSLISITSPIRWMLYHFIVSTNVPYVPL